MTSPLLNRRNASWLFRLPSFVTAGALALLVVLVIVLAGRPLATDDLWFHLKMGETYLREGLWPAVDPMLHTAGSYRPVQHEWLFGVVVFLTHQLVGLHGLRMVHALAVVVILWLAFGLFRREARSVVAVLAALAVFILLSWWRLMQFRPDLFSIAAILLLYRLVLCTRRPLSRNRIAGALALLWVWANMHSLFLIGLLLIAAAALGAWFRRRLRADLGDASSEDTIVLRRLLLMLAAGFAVTLLNPRGMAQHLTFVLSSAGTSVWEVKDEWMPFFPFWPGPPHNHPNLHLLTWISENLLLVLLVSFFALGYRRYRNNPSAKTLRAIDPELFFIAFASASAAFISFRFLWLGIFSLLLVLRVASVVWPAKAISNLAVRVTLAVTVVGAVFAYLQLPQIGGWQHAMADTPGGKEYFSLAVNRTRYSHAGVMFLKDTRVTGRLFNQYSLGGYLGYHLAPDLRTFIDGRAEHYPPEVYQDYRAIELRRPNDRGETYLQILDRRGVDFFFGEGGIGHRYQINQTVDHVRGAPGWICVFRSLGHGIYLRQHPRNAPNLQRIAAYYQAHGVPFDPNMGLDVHRVVQTSPKWAIQNRLLPPFYFDLARQARQRDQARRARAAAILAHILLAVGDYEGTVSYARVAIAANPARTAPRIWLVRALAELGNHAAADRAACTWSRGDPGNAKAAALCRWAKSRHLGPGTDATE